MQKIIYILNQTEHYNSNSPDRCAQPRAEIQERLRGEGRVPDQYLKAEETKDSGIRKGFGGRFCPIADQR